jgi:uncharacterized membrane protein YbaN (DUF454 family)
LKWILISIGALTVFGGFLTFWLPIPVGLPLMMLGVPLLLRYSPHARAWILQLAKVSPKIHRLLSKIQPAERTP